MKNKGIWLVILSIIVAGIVITMGTNLFVKNQKMSGAQATEAALMTEETQANAVASDIEGVEAGAPAPMAELEGPAIPEAVMAGDAAPQARTAAEPVPTEADVEVQMETLALVETVRSPLETEETSLESVLISEGGEMKAGAKAAVTSVSDYRTRLDELGVQIQKIREGVTESTTYSLKTAAENELKLWDSELNLIYNDLLNYLSDEEDLKLIEEEREWMKARDAAAVEAAKKSAGGTLEGLEYTASLAESTKQRAYELADIHAEVTK